MNGESKKRVYFLDILRGILIIYVVYYHFMYDLNDIVGREIPYLYSKWFSTVRDIMSGSLIFISGISCNFSADNIKRGIRTIVIAMGLTVVTYFVMPEQTIIFGILHLLGTMMLLAGIIRFLSGKIKKGRKDDIQVHEYKSQVMWIRYIFALILFALFICCYDIYWGRFGIGALSVNLPEGLYGSFPMYIMGFKGNYFSADYYPLLPWGLLFLCGDLTGYIFKKNNLPALFYKNFCNPLAFIGRHTMVIYLVHQPVILGICMLAAYFTR